MDLAKYWDESADYQSGDRRIDVGLWTASHHGPHARTQAIIGKTGNGAFSLPAVAASFKTPFVSVIFTPLDNLPLVQSRHILITALARDKQAGTRYSAAGTMLESCRTAAAGASAGDAEICRRQAAGDQRA